MSKKNITFIATQYKNKPINVSFYTREGEKVRFTGTAKIPVKAPVSFRAKKS